MNTSKTLLFRRLTLFFCVSAMCYAEDAKTTSPSSKSPLTVEWSDGIALYSVVYKIDGKLIGRGKAAYEHVFATIRSLPNESIVVVRRPADIAGYLLDTTGADSPFPFGERRTEELELQGLLTRKRISMSTQTFVYPDFLEKK